jgi:hypothetical protein
MLGIGFWVLGTGYLVLSIVYWVLYAGCLMLDAGYWMMVDGKVRIGEALVNALRLCERLFQLRLIRV